MKKALFIYTMVLAIIILPSCHDNNGHKSAIFEGEDLMGKVQILRDKKTKIATAKINVDGPWKLYAGSSVDNINFENPVLIGTGAGDYLLNVPDSMRSYFQMITDDGKAILAEKHLPMDGGYNFRDLGGTRTVEGKYVKWGKIFRSDDFVHLTGSDLRYLSNIPIRSVVDFRAKEEIKGAPDKLPTSVHNNYVLSITPGNLSLEYLLSNIDVADVNQIMIDLNLQLVGDSSSISRYREFFKILEDGDNAPVIYHCSAGKDRTGMATALMLSALGVDERTIMNDYLLSNMYLADKYAPLLAEYPKLEPMFVVKDEYIQAGLDKMKKDHGSVENYLIKVLGVDIPKMKSMYLY